MPTTARRSNDALLTGGKDWPVDLSLSFLGSAAKVSGTLVHAADGWRGALTFGLGTPDVSEIERLLQASLPAVGATDRCSVSV